MEKQVQRQNHQDRNVTGYAKSNQDSPIHAAVSFGVSKLVVAGPQWTMLGRQAEISQCANCCF